MLTVQAQQFLNLDFEDARLPLTPIPGDVYQRVAVDHAIPGWRLFTGDLEEEGILYRNSFFSGTAGWNLVDDRTALGISGFSVHLLSGVSVHGGGMTDTSLRQTGLVPADAKTLSFGGGTYNSTVSLDGVALELLPLGDGRYGAEISVFAGRTVELRFTADYSLDRPWNDQGAIWVDSVRFSSVPLVPEPSIWALLGLGAVFGIGLWIRW
jgi:hypothetical protein